MISLTIRVVFAIVRYMNRINLVFPDVSGSQDIDDDGAKTVLSLLADYIDNEQHKIFSKKKEFENDENKIQSEIDSLR